MRIRSLCFAAALAAATIPSAAAAQAAATPVLRAGEISVGAEILPAEIIGGNFVIPSDRSATPSTGFSLRYAFDNRLALIGTLGFELVTIADDHEDPDVRYSVGLGGQFNLIQSRSSAFFFRGGLQFIPRIDRDSRGNTDQELGVRLWAGPGVEARVAESLSLQFYTSLMDLQLGADTRFDLEIVPSIAAFIYF